VVRCLISRSTSNVKNYRKLLFLHMINSFYNVHLNVLTDLTVPTVLQHFEFLDFSNTTELNFLNAAEIDQNNILTLCPNKTNNQGQAWFMNKVQLQGFTSTFTFRLSGGQGK
jgi:hypothetical protein